MIAQKLETWLVGWLVKAEHRHRQLTVGASYGLRDACASARRAGVAECVNVEGDTGVPCKRKAWPGSCQSFSRPLFFDLSQIFAIIQTTTSLFIIAFIHQFDNLGIVKHCQYLIYKVHLELASRHFRRPSRFANGPQIYVCSVRLEADSDQ